MFKIVMMFEEVLFLVYVMDDLKERGLATSTSC